MKATLLILANFLFVLNCISQIYIKTTVVGTPNFNSMNNTVVSETFNLSDKSYFMYAPSPNVSSEIINIQDTLFNFGIDTMNASMNSRIDYFSSNGYISHYQLSSTVVLPKFNYSVTSYIEPSSMTSTDGSITISFDSVVPFNTLIFVHRNEFYNDTAVIDAHTIRFDSLSSEYLQIVLGDLSDASNYVDFRIIIGDPNEIYVNTGMDMNLTVIHADNNCEGMLLTQATNSQGTLYNVWGDEVYNEFNRTALCPGIYSVYTYDLVNGYYNYGSIDTMIITNNYNAYIDSSIFNYTPQDTAYFNSLNCQFDFNAPIDSINYIEDTLFNNGGELIVGFEFTIYQGNNFVSLTDSLVLGMDSLVTIEVVLYCDQFKSTFQGRRIVYLRGAPTHNFSQAGDLGDDLLSPSSVELYPNPVVDEIHLSFPQETVGDILIYDSAGKFFLKESTNGLQDLIFDVSALSSGIYFLKFDSKNTDKVESFTSYFVKQ